MTDTPTWQELLDLVAQLNGSDYDSASVQFGDVSVKLSKSADALLDAGAAPAAPRVPHAETPAAPSTHVSVPTIPASAASPAPPTANTIDAPMIGVFYRRPSPGAEPFVQPGDTVDADTTIGIIEIMKLMNPITAGKAGVIGEFLAEDGQAVEFGQPIATLK